jgi:hypothetical protein
VPVSNEIITSFESTFVKVQYISMGSLSVMSSNWNKACVGSLHTSVELDDVADDANGRGIEIDSSVCCCGHGDVDSISTNGELLVGLSEGSNGSDDDDDDGNFDEDEGAVDVNTDVMLGLFEGEDTNGRKSGCDDVNGRSLLAADDNVRLGDVSGGGPDKTPVSVDEEEDDGSEVCEILDLHASPKSNDASPLPKLFPSMTSLSS